MHLHLLLSCILNTRSRSVTYTLTGLFRDEEVAYAQHSWKDGVSCELNVVPGTYLVFLFFSFLSLFIILCFLPVIFSRLQLIRSISFVHELLEYSSNKELLQKDWATHRKSILSESIIETCLLLVLYVNTSDFYYIVSQPYSIFSFIFILVVILY